MSAALQIETEPEARVVVDGHEIGTTPLTVERGAGQIKLKLIPKDSTLPPYETTLSLTPQVKTIVRRKFSVNNLSQSLEQISFTKENTENASLTVVTKPVDTQILIDNNVELTNPRKINLSEGAHRVAISSPGYESKEIPVQTAIGYNLTLYVELPFLQKVDVSSTPSLGTFVILPAPGGSAIILKDASVASIELGRVKSGELVEGIARDEQNELFKIITKDGRQGWILQKYASPSAATK